ncbi:hypothetical protein VTK73DRAFT_8359 [Phialemonium thermophilum]|uniref:Family c-likeg-protein-coupled receptor protein n=1 Tax=Phialemonium thermophilum TaxID=223376 RepID=A0ABR3XPA6_9PEZI
MSGAPASGSPVGQQTPHGPPYLPRTAQIGGVPTVSVDVPISAVLLFLFVCGAATHMTILQVNRRRDHKFLFSGMLFGFCMARIVALTMRMVWATHSTNINVAIASGIFTQAGVLLLFVVNLIFSQRMVRAYRPRFGWHRTTTVVFRTLYCCVVALLIMVVTATVQSFFTLDKGTLHSDRIVQLFAVTFLAALAFLPIPIVTAAALLPGRQAEPLDKFGQGRFRTKVRLLLFTATILALGAGFRAGAAYDVRPINHPAWYHHKACYYCFNYAIELIMVYTYAITRFDRRFHVPDGSSGPGHYSAGRVRKQEPYSDSGRRPSFIADHIGREADTFGSDGNDDSDGLAEQPSSRDDTQGWSEGAKKGSPDSDV